MPIHIRVSAGPEDQARILDLLTLAFCSDPFVRWMYPETAQYYRHYREFAELFGGKALRATLPITRTTTRLPRYGFRLESERTTSH
jgi:hypothetical protein